ncbi:MAG: hypothetical protein QXT64_04945 [Desulfurococcaceae archaeon]
MAFDYNPLLTEEDIAKRRAELMQLEKEQLVEMLIKYMRMLQGADSETVSWLADIGSLYRVLRRDYQPVDGILVRANFELESIELAVVDTKTDWQTKAKTTEWKIVKIRPGSTVMFEKILDRREEGEEEDDAP